MTGTRWFFAPPQAWESDTVLLSPEESRHLARVLRLPIGAEVVVTDGAGRAAKARVAGQERDRVRLQLVAEYSARTESPLALTLAVGQAKGEALDRVVELATELGAWELVAFASRYAEALPPERQARRLARWERLAREALKLCRRARLPRLAVSDFESLLTRPEEVRILFYEEERGGLRPVGLPPRPAGVLLIIGPEGGFAPEEVNLAREAGLVVAGLGPRRLRVETAAAAALGLAQFLWGDLT
ncbi:MAG: RsmE family RNA methyltransferase [Desulfobaccales bacterium]